jgi:hypothetical protein
MLKATIPALIAALTWVLPLCAIAAPASLTSVISFSTTPTTCHNIPSVDFSGESSLTISSTLNSIFFVDSGNDAVTYYDSPSTTLIKDVTITLLTGKGALAPSNPCPESGNCSYAIEFSGPAYDCQERPDYAPSANTSMTKAKLTPTGNYSYFGLSSIWEEDSGQPAEWFYPVNPAKDLGTFKVEPDLWLGYAINSTIPLAEPYITAWGAIWRHNFTQHVLQCTMYNATYSYDISWSNGVMIAINQSTQLHSPIPGSSPYSDSDYHVLA